MARNGTGSQGFVTLAGAARDTGLALGRGGAAFLRRRARLLKRLQRARGISDRDVDARVRSFERRLKKVARHWLDEAAGMADGAGVTVRDVLLMNCPPPGMHVGVLDSCTSFLSIGRAENRLFKIRDERYNAQCFYIHGTRAGTRVQFAKDIGNLGTAHFLNSFALAGACDTGSATCLVSDEPRLNDCHLLRLISESARAVDEIPDLFARWIEADVVGGAGPGRGAILLFVDANRGLILECASRDFAVRYIDRGTHAVANHFLIPKARRWASGPPNKNTLTRQARMAELLARRGRDLNEVDVFAISRDRKSLPNALCNDQYRGGGLTVSAQLQVIPRRDPHGAVNYICCGNTRNSVYLPVPVGETDTFLPLLDGRYFAHTDTLYRIRGCGPHLRAAQAAFERDTVASPDYRAACVEAFGLLGRQAAEARRAAR